jgi:centromere protein C
MQPLDDLLSSPDRETASPPNNDDEDNDHYESGDNEDDDEGSEDMDIETSPHIEAYCSKTHLLTPL